MSLLPELPFGTARDASYGVQRLSLRPGDRLLFLTDGMLDRNASAVDIDAALIAGAKMHPREAVQHLVGAVLCATDGDLADDATVMCLDGHGGPPRNRTSDSGANR